ncbi:MAG: type IIL restriction-modification enzyme MmeI, partial [Hydrogenophaga sp.]
MATSRDVLVIDAFGMSAEHLRERFPAVFQWLVERVKPERDSNNRASYRNNWWFHGEPRKVMRGQLSGLPRYIATVETAKHRVFQFLDAAVLPDNMLVAIATNDSIHLGVLSSQVHVEWALAAGGRLGVGNDPRYNKSRCFETFPFPHDDTGLTPALTERIRQLAEQLDAHRKARQAAHESVTLTGLYNVLDKLRRGEPLNAKDKALHEQGLVSVLQSLHDELDAAVLQAYGWSDLGAVPWADEAARAAWTETLLERLVALNAKRAAEEAAGTVRWLRP